MRFYVLEYQPGMLGTAPERVLETSRARALEKMYSALQMDAFPQSGATRPVMPRMFIIDIPTPVKKSTVMSLIKGEIYQYIVNEDGEPNPQPSPAKAQEMAMRAAVEELPEDLASKNLRPFDPEKDARSDIEKEADGQASMLGEDEEEEVMPF